MNSKFQILLMTAALAMVGVSIASLYGDDGSPPAATPVPAALPATPALAPAATALPAPGAAPVAAVEAPTIMPDRPVPLPNEAPKTAAPRSNSPMLPPATFTDPQRGPPAAVVLDFRPREASKSVFIQLTEHAVPLLPGVWLPGAGRDDGPVRWQRR